MALQVTGQAQGVILAASQKSGAPAAVSTGWHNELLAAELFPRYTYLSLSGVVFSVSYAAAAMAVPSATATGAFALFNPAGSGKNLLLLKYGTQLATFTAGTTSLSVGLQFVPNQSPTATGAGNTPQNAFVGNGNTPVAKAFVSGTLVGAPTALSTLYENFYVDLAATSFATTTNIEIDGGVIIAPNSGVCIASAAAPPTNTCTAFLKWAELPI